MIGHSLSMNTVHNMDCVEGMKLIPDNSIDSIVTDPPYEIEFMGKGWDSTGIANNVDMWRECLRVLKPGGHLLSFAATRTYHRMACAIEDAGFEVRDMIEWVYGSGFPKSHNIGKSVYKIKGTSEWEGWGTTLKPAHESICMARKPLAEKTVAENCLKYGTGGINIDESRVGTDIIKINHINSGANLTHNKTGEGNGKRKGKQEQVFGRFPANIIHDNSEEVRECFPNTGKDNGKGAYYAGVEYDNKDTSLFNGDKPQAPINYNDDGNASRFFKSILYYPKASKKERNEGFDIVENKNTRPQGEAFGDGNAISEHNNRKGNFHPTIKPVALMEYLIKMVTKEGGTVLDPFTGSGTTLVAAKKNGYNYIGFELTEEYIPIIETRLQSVLSPTNNNG